MPQNNIIFLCIQVTPIAINILIMQGMGRVGDLRTAVALIYTLNTWMALVKM